MHISKNIFKEYDIRGKIGKELNEEVAYKLGQLFSSGLKQIIIAKDNRISSKNLMESFIQGSRNTGANVIELEGTSTSPLLYFASNFLEAEGAVMVTGSHNNLEFSGFKFLLHQKPLFGKELLYILNNTIKYGNGKYSQINLDSEYLKKAEIPLDTKFKIIWECNNSANGRLIAKSNFNSPNLLLNSETNGIFAHNPPDPCLDKNLSLIKSHIKKHSADFGFAFDGDGDRLVMIKSKGEVLTGDQLIYLLAHSIKVENKKILIDVKASQILINHLKNDGFEVILAASGHSLMKERIIRENASFAGELSGHFIFNDSNYFPLDDAFYAALRVIEYLKNNPLPQLPLPAFKGEYKIAKDKNLPEQVYKPEGMRKNFDDGFWLLRASNTEDYVLVKYEAENKIRANSIKEELSSICFNLI